MKSEHVLKIRFSPPGSGTWDFTVPAVVDRCLLDTCGAHGPRLIGCVPQFPEIIEKHCFLDALLKHLSQAVLKRLDEEYAHGWNPDCGLNFAKKRTSRPRKPKPSPVDTDQLVRKAAKFAEDAHHEAGNVRKYTGEGYIQHPAAVVELIKTVPHTPEMLQAAWLHDVLEDTKVTLKQIKDTFGEKVFALVWQLTDRMALADGNRKLRKAVERLRYSYVSNEAKTIKLADLIDNAKSIIKHDPDFAKVYMKEMRDLLSVLREGDSSLWLKATNICDTYDRGLYTKQEPENAEQRPGLSTSMGCRYNWTNFTDRPLFSNPDSLPWDDVADPESYINFLAGVWNDIKRHHSYEKKWAIKNSIQKKICRMFMDGKSRELRELDMNVEHNGCGEFIAIIRYHIKDNCC